MNATSAYAFGSLGWHLIQALPLIIWPEVVAGLLLSSGGGDEVNTDIMVYFARSLGLSLVALGMTTVSLTGAIPLGSPADNASPDPEAPLSPYVSAVLFVTSLHHAAAASYCWMRYSGLSSNNVDYDPGFDYYSTTSHHHHHRPAQQHPMGFFFGTMGSASLACFGLWCLLFAGGPQRRSKRTGKDKHTSGWLFRNPESVKNQ